MDKLDHPGSSAEVRDRLAEDIRNLVRDSESLLRVAQQQGLEGIATMRDRLESSLSQVRQQLCESEHSWRQQTKERVQQANTYVQGHPWTAIGVTAGAALLLGVLLGRR